MSLLKETDDLSRAQELTQDTIRKRLEERYKKDVIYTYVGDILLAVNPFKPLKIYGEEV